MSTTHIQPVKHGSDVRHALVSKCHRTIMTSERQTDKAVVKRSGTLLVCRRNGSTNSAAARRANSHDFHVDDPLGGCRERTKATTRTPSVPDTRSSTNAGAGAVVISDVLIATGGSVG